MLLVCGRFVFKTILTATGALHRSLSGVSGGGGRLSLSEGFKLGNGGIESVGVWVCITKKMAGTRRIVAKPT